MSLSKEFTTGKDLLWNNDGSIYHLGLKKGEIFERILTVGSHSRADDIGKFLDNHVINKVSGRLFKTISGYYKGIGVSIIAIGMGYPNADFLLREASVLLEGKKMYIIRLGTCGLFSYNLEPGTIVVASKGSAFCGRNYNYFDGKSDNWKNGKPYFISDVCPADEDMSKILLENLKKQNVKCAEGKNLSAETFFAAQGRKHEDFYDDNDFLTEEIKAQNVDTVEMESHTILHLAKHRKSAPAFATAAHIGILNRVNPNLSMNITEDEMIKGITKGGIAALDTLIAMRDD